MTPKLESVQIVILAAGAASRFGSPKQLAIWQNKTLLEHAIEKSASINCPVSIVLGAHAQQIKEVIVFPKNVQIIENLNWQKGLSSSVKLAIQSLQKSSAILFLAVDQVLINVADLNKLLQNYLLYPDKIIAAFYSQITGIPLIIPQLYFEQIAQLEGDVGIKQILNQYQSQIIAVDMPNAAFDVDTVQDLTQLK